MKRAPPDLVDEAIRRIIDIWLQIEEPTASHLAEMKNELIQQLSKESAATEYELVVVGMLMLQRHRNW